ncbi:cilia- and flagella-associated protein 74 isoform X2 [Alligator sinensis]|uniref:Cilia- and flagella-associated protein 74 isoform X2 n=1 Tax=Alligator sinensis TaxID=38654 RepID=A0A1U7RDZ2_ALLSI|nr:cilia- and flagella-associated protein 74 isoform X2 [Alligator sinensis]
MEGIQLSDSGEEEQTSVSSFQEEEKDDITEQKLREEPEDDDKTRSKENSKGVGGDFDYSREGLEHYVSNVNNNNNNKTMKYADRVSILTLRRNINQLDNLSKEKDIMIQKTREELSACHLRIKILTKQRESVETKIEKEKKAGNAAAMFRLQAAHRRLCTELENAKDLEPKIALLLKENVYDMWQIEIEQGKFGGLREQLEKDEETLERQYKKRTEERIQKEKAKVLLMEQKEQAVKKKEMESQEEYERRHQKVIEDAQRNNEKAVQCLKKTMARIYQKKAKEELETQEHMERRMQAVLSLKNNITSNRETLRALQARDKARALEAKNQEMKMRETILAGGGNVAKEIFLHKRLVEFERHKLEFKDQQKSKKIEIVARILQEEAYMQKQEKYRSRTEAVRSCSKLQDSAPWKIKTWNYIEKTCEDPAAAVLQKSWRSPSACASVDEKSSSEKDFSGKVSHSMIYGNDEEESEEEQDETLAEPEFTGLWSQEYALNKVSKEETDLKPHGASKMEREIFTQNLKKLRSGMIHKQVVSGHEFKGCPFYSKPSVIHFEDFDVGKTYKKKIILINASYSVNFCKLVGVSEHLKDFISIHFDPPGQMSAGMSCEMVVTFKPMINEDLEGEVTFLAQTGSFSIPLKCTVKRCVLALDKELIDFGTHVVGETISRTITLTNRGALGTRFKLQTSAGDSGTCTTATKSSLKRVISPTLDGVISEERDSSSPMGSVFEKKEQVSPDQTDETIKCLSQPESQKTKTSLGSSCTKQFSQDAPIPKADLEAKNTQSPLEPLLEESPVEITLGKVTEGEIGPFSSVKLQVIFVPAIPGDVQAEFVFTFDNQNSNPLFFTAIGVSVDVPVWVTNPNVDLKICMYDRLYQDCIVIQSRAKAALRLKFEVCKKLSKYMELLPKTGYIQAQSSFSVQLKFLPRHSLPEDAGEYFDKETRVLEVPMTISVADKVKPVTFTVHAIVTTSDLEISPAEVNFGYCTIYEAVQTTITLTNKCILPQEFGFVDLPEFVEIQPDDGFGTLLPLESLNLDIIFKANKAKDYSFELICKTEINRQFKLSCKAVGVHPPLELSHSLVQFAATALNDVSTATLYVINSHVSLNRFTHAVPRIGKGQTAPVGPTSFEFHVPESSPVTVMPSVGTVLPGKKCLIQVSFRPVLSDQQIRKEAVQMLSRATATRTFSEKRMRESEMQVNNKKKDDSLAGKREGRKASMIGIKRLSSIHLSKDRDSKHLTTSGIELPKPEDIKPHCEEYMAAQSSLIRNFRGKFEKYIIPCFVASGDIDEKRGSETLNYSPYNTLYLELHCPAVAPSVVITSDNGKNIINFGEVAVGHRITKQITIQNILDEQLAIGFSILNPHGPFLLVNPVECLQPGKNQLLVISFCPDENKLFFETLDIYTVKNTLTLSITGHGVTPSIACSVEGEILDMGYVIAKEKGTSTFKIQNTSTLALKYSMQLESLSQTRDRELQKLPSFLTSPTKRTELVGTQNYNGSSVFSVFPVEGVIDIGKSQDFTVTFSPDHESLYYSDCLKVILFGKEIAHVIQLKGAARDHMMFVEGGDPLDVTIESLVVTSPISEEAAKRELEETAKSILLSLEYIQGETSPTPAMRELKVGAIGASQFASKKNVEFSLDGLALLQQKGFTVEPIKGTVDHGQTKCISVSWVPPTDFDPAHPLTATATLTLKGDIKETYKVLFMARVVSALTH